MFKSVDRAVFRPDGRQLATISRSTVTLHALEGRMLTPKPLWKAKVTHAVTVAFAPGAGRVIVTDTSGRHFGLCAQTGAVLWKVLGPSEGSAAVIVPDGTGQAASGLMFLFIGWKGVMQRLDPADGAELAPLHSFGHRVRKLYQARDTGGLCIEKSLLPGAPEVSLCRLELDPVRVTQIMPITASFGAIASPDQTRMIAAGQYEIVPGDSAMRGQTFAVVEVPSGKVVAERRFVVGHFPVHQAFWSPDGRWICIFEGDDLHLLDADTLESRGEVAADHNRKSAFHPGGDHLCVSRQGKSAIMPIADILG